jgi:hypothetical protein
VTPASTKPTPVAHSNDREDFYVVEMLDGTRRWLAVPAGTTTRLVQRVSNPAAYRRQYDAKVRA